MTLLYAPGRWLLSWIPLDRPLGYLSDRWLSRIKDPKGYLLSEALVAALILVLIFLIVRWTVREGVPWLGPRLARVVAGTARLLCGLVAFPEFCVTWAVRRSGREPGRLLYEWGELALGGVRIVDGVLVRPLHYLRQLGPAELARRYPGRKRRRVQAVHLLVVGLLVLGGFQSWNSARCEGPTAAAVATTCTHPVQQWWAQVKAVTGADQRGTTTSGPR